MVDSWGQSGRGAASHSVVERRSWVVRLQSVRQAQGAEQCCLVNLHWRALPAELAAHTWLLLRKNTTPGRTRAAGTDAAAGG